MPFDQDMLQRKYVEPIEPTIGEIWKIINLSIADSALAKARDRYEGAREVWMTDDMPEFIQNQLEIIVNSGWLKTFERHAGWAGIDIPDEKKLHREFAGSMIPKFKQSASREDVEKLNGIFGEILNYYSDLIKPQ